MQDIIFQILKKYRPARDNTPFRGPHEISELFNRLKSQIADLPCVKANKNLIVKSSYGKGNWATVPWLAILDTRETSTTQDGTYLVFLFQEEGKGCHLKLAQGVTEVFKQSGKNKAIKTLETRASVIRDRYLVQGLEEFVPTEKKVLETDSISGVLYESSTIFAKYFERDQIPSDADLSTDIERLLEVYGQYVLDRLQESQHDEPVAEDESSDYFISSIVSEGAFASTTFLDQVLERLRTKKNIILQGPPGTGKTWLAKKLGFALIGQKTPHRVRVVQFHANLSYEDFVRGYRPTAEGKLALVDGVFMQAVAEAQKTTQPVVLVIEEINRGNPAQILGELLTLLETDKRGADDAIELTYRRENNERVFVPPNLYVIGTMNIADRSLALVDLALRRRFAFIDLEPTFNDAWRKWLVSSCSMPKELVSQIESKMMWLNSEISNDSRLGPQFAIGHSYVTPHPDSELQDHHEWFRQVIHTEISPLLREYWFDDQKNAEKHINELLRGL